MSALAASSSRVHRPAREPGGAAGILVAAIATAFGVLLISIVRYLTALLTALVGGDSGPTLGFMLGVMAVVVGGIAVYAAAIVTANTFATIVAGRTRRIALMRLVGASAVSQRRAVAGEGLRVGAVGAAIGLVIGAGVAATAAPVADGMLHTATHYAALQPVLLLPAVVVIGTTWAAAWVGSHRVLDVTPLQALNAAGDITMDGVRRRSGRNVAALVLIIVGVVVLAGGVMVGLLSAGGVLISFVGGVLSFTGILLGSTLVVPPLLRAVGMLFGRSVIARLAAGNALRHPERSSRMAVGVIMGVTLVTMFAVATASSRDALVGDAPAHVAAQIDHALSGVTAVAIGLVLVSAIIAGVGLVNLLWLGVVQRRRELALLRAVGLSTGQVRGVVLMEAAHVTVTAVVAGLALGTVYGWVAAQSMFGARSIAVDAPQFVWPVIPLDVVLVIVAATAVLTLAAAVLPTRLATRVSPVAALAAE